MSENLKAVVFKLNKELYGLNILTDVGEIIKMPKLFRVPGLSDNVEGVINLRGKVTAVVNLRKRLGLAEDVVDKNATPKQVSEVISVDEVPEVSSQDNADVNETRKIILLADMDIGLIVDEVSEIITINPKDIEDRSKLHFLVDSSLISCIAKVNGDIITILDTKELISNKVAAKV